MKLNKKETNRTIFGADWSRAKVDIFDPSTKTTASYPTLEDAAPHYAGQLLILEATGESFQLQRRQTVLDAFKQHDILAYCFNSRYTSKFRIANNVPKSDKNDAKVIYRIATETPLTLHRFKALRDGDPLRDKIQDSLVKDRYLFNEENSQKASVKYLDKQEIPTEYDYLMVEKLTGRKGAKKRKYRTQAGRILMVAEQVRKAGRGYREFRRQLGNYAQGYGSMARSEYYWHWGRNLLNREIKATKTTKSYKEGALDPRTGKPMKIRDWSNAEKDLRVQMRHTIQKAAQWLWRKTA